MDIRKLNEYLRSELGSNPQYGWKWSEDLFHVMEVIQPDGTPVYVEGRSPSGLTIMVPKTERRKLLPHHNHCWVICALVEVNERDGSIAGTGDHAWVPVSSANSGPVCIMGEPDMNMTRYVVEAIRESRSRRPVEMTADLERDIDKRERDHWTRIYDQICDASTAFYNVPGRKGAVSFGGLAN